MSRVLISVPEKLLNIIDATAEAEHRTRSELLRESFREYVKKMNVENKNKYQEILKRLMD